MPLGTQGDPVGVDDLSVGAKRCGLRMLAAAVARQLAAVEVLVLNRWQQRLSPGL